jgi:hypothetical protein
MPQMEKRGGSARFNFPHDVGVKLDQDSPTYAHFLHAAGAHAEETGLHGGYKNAGWDRTLGKMFNFRAAAGCHLLFLAAELSILTMVEVLDVLSSRVIVFNCSLWRLILQNSGSPFTGGLFFDVLLKRRREVEAVLSGFCPPPQHLDLVPVKRACCTLHQITQFDIVDRDPNQSKAFDIQALEHSPDLPVTALAQLDFKPRASSSRTQKLDG